MTLQPGRTLQAWTVGTSKEARVRNNNATDDHNRWAGRAYLISMPLRIDHRCHALSRLTNHRQDARGGSLEEGATNFLVRQDTANPLVIG